MTYREPLSNQVLIFISAIGPGVLIGLIYDVIFSFLSTFGNKRPLVIAADLCFSVSATLISFFYMVIFNSGTVRLNMIMAQLIGAVAFHYTLGKYLMKPVNFIAKSLSRVIGIILLPAMFICRKISRIIGKMRDKLKEKTKTKEKSEKIRKKLINILKIHLKKNKKSVY